MFKFEVQNIIVVSKRLKLIPFLRKYDFLTVEYVMIYDRDSQILIIVYLCIGFTPII